MFAAAYIRRVPMIDSGISPYVRYGEHLPCYRPFRAVDESERNGVCRLTRHAGFLRKFAARDPTAG